MLWLDALGDGSSTFAGPRGPRRRLLIARRRVPQGPATADDIRPRIPRPEGAEALRHRLSYVPRPLPNPESAPTAPDVAPVEQVVDHKLVPIVTTVAPGRGLSVNCPVFDKTQRRTMACAR